SNAVIVSNIHVIQAASARERSRPELFPDHINPDASRAARIFGSLSAVTPATGERHGPIGVPSIWSAAFTPPGAVQSESACRSGFRRSCAALDASRSPRRKAL